MRFTLARFWNRPIMFVGNCDDKAIFSVDVHADGAN